MTDPQPLPPVRYRHSGAATEAPAALPTTPSPGKRLMARARIIKPGFFLNERLAELHPLTRILFAGLWCNADRLGRLEDRPKKIKAAILPYDDHDIDRALDDLQAGGFISRYRNCASTYIQVLAFGKHQRPHLREVESEIPDPDLGSAEAQPRHGPGTAKARSSPNKMSLIQDPGSTGSTRSKELPIPLSSKDETSLENNSLLLHGAVRKSAHTSTPEATTIFLKTCKKGEEWEVPLAKIAEWEDSFPDVDVRLTLLAIRQWCCDNPRKRKTAGGMVRWIGGWMRREQDKPN